MSDFLILEIISRKVMKRLAGDEPIVAVPVVAEPVEVQHPAVVVPVEVRHVEVAVGVAQIVQYIFQCTAS